jgi:hypothetical protein
VVKFAIRRDRHPTENLSPSRRNLVGRLGGEAWGTSEARLALEHEIGTDRGVCCLRLTPEPYAKLKRP